MTSVIYFLSPCKEKEEKYTLFLDFCPLVCSCAIFSKCKRKVATHECVLTEGMSKSELWVGEESVYGCLLLVSELSTMISFNYVSNWVY